MLYLGRRLRFLCRAGPRQPDRGKYADLVVLDRDITAIPAESIGTAKVLMTMVNGKTTYQTL